DLFFARGLPRGAAAPAALVDGEPLMVNLRKEPFPTGPATLQWMVSGYLFSSVLFSAVELGVFDQLEARPGDASQLAARLQASIPGTQRLLDALCALGLCRRDD